MRGEATPLRVTIVTLDNHMAAAIDRAGEALRAEMPGLVLTQHAIGTWGGEEAPREACRADIERADVIVVSMIFLEEHARTLAPWLEARREDCDCLVACLSAAEIVKLTRLGELNMANPTGGLIGLLKKLRGKPKAGQSAGQRQMRLLRALPRFLRFIPGKAQDLRAYFLTLQYMLAGSEQNLANLVRFLVNRYASGERAALKGAVPAGEPIRYPETGLYHRDLPHRVSDDPAAFAKVAAKHPGGRVGVLVMRSYILAENTAHYDGVIAALEAQGLTPVPAFAAGLDARPAVERFFMSDGRASVDAVVSLTGFSLVGGPAYNDSAAAEAALAELDVPYLSAFAVEFQSLERWEAGTQGLSPVETTIMVSLPEIDGATGPILFGGRREGSADPRDLAAHDERAGMLAKRVAKLIALRRRPVAERRVAVVLYDFPPNSGATGSAAYLSVFESLHNVLGAMKRQGYAVELPESVAALRAAVLEGNASWHGMPANVIDTIEVDDHVARQPWLDEIEAQWGPAPGRHQSNGRGIHMLGARFGNVTVAIQPQMGIEGDPMRLLFEGGFAPTHAFAAFYRWLREGVAADAVLHFGTHGALEFMPGKQVGLSGDCWPDRLIGDLPNIYLYAANNPSEGTIARRRAAATLVSHLTPPLAHAGLYKGLVTLKADIDRWRATEPGAEEAGRLATAIREQAQALDLVDPEAAWSAKPDTEIVKLAADLRELEATLIPDGLHVVGRGADDAAREQMLGAVDAVLGEEGIGEAAVSAIVRGEPAPASVAGQRLARLDRDLRENDEIAALLHALDGRYVRPVAGGDVVRSPEIVPTGRNLHGFDPFRLPTAAALADGRAQAERLLDRHRAEAGRLPESVAMVLWGTDNMKSEGAQLSQALALMGAAPRFDGFGRLAGADLIPLEDLGRPRIDVVITLSGIFRDLLPLQTRLLADAAEQAALADEPVAMNLIRRNALRDAEAQGIPLEQAALRVFSNAAGAYGSNVNMLIDSGAWDAEDELADTYTARKCFAYGRDGEPVRRPEQLGALLGRVEAAYQNVESVELGVTSIDHYFDTLGGIARAVAKSGGGECAVYVGDQTTGTGKVRTLSEQVALEARTRMLNPKWQEGLLAHGYEGVRQIESHVTNTFGWSATTGHVDPWVYQNLTETFVLDEAMRRRLAELNPQASAKLAGRLIEAGERAYWTPDPETWEALRAAGEELEDRVEGITVESAA